MKNNKLAKSKIVVSQRNQWIDKVSFFILFFLVFGVSKGFAQIQVDNSITPQDLVAVIVGDGISFSNVTFSGELYQFGSFEENGSGLGIANGAILGTGDVVLAEGPNDEEGASLGDGEFGNSSDPDLVVISGVEINDAAILEFDFIPQGDDVTFHYVFGSEEYNEFVCSDVNDAFGFFLSGPGITGSFSSPANFPDGSVNIALIPGGNIGVSIGTVNNGTAGFAGDEFFCDNLDPNWQSNTAYFIDNNNSTTIQYDGLTVVMEATHAVQCGETYHIKLAIGDGGDSSYDSGVFLEENSFSSVIPVSIDLQIDQDTEIENGVFENCGAAVLEFIRGDDDLSQELTIDLIYSGDAENGEDYDLPASITFLPNENTVELFFDPFADGMAEDVENRLISMETNNGCAAQENIELVEMFIIDVEPLILTTNDVTFCDENSVELIPEVSGGAPPYTYQWSNGEAASTITVTPDGPMEYTLAVNDQCGGDEATGVFNVFVGNAPSISYPPESIQIVCEDLITVECVVDGGYEQITFTTNNNEVVGNQNPLIYNTALGAESLTVSIVDECGATAQVLILIDIIEPPALQVEIGDDVNVSCIDLTSWQADVQGGGSPFEYSWLLNGAVVGQELNYSFNTQQTVQLTFEVEDGCGQLASDMVTIHVPDNPISLSVTEDLLVCPHIGVSVSAEASGGEGGFTYLWSDLGEGQTHSFMAEESNDYSVVVTDICGESVTQSVHIGVIDFAVGVVQDEVVENEFAFEAITYPACDGGCSFFWDFGDNATAIGENTSHTYDGSDEYQGYLTVINQEGCIDSANFVVFPPMTFFVPNSFSPNDDGVNDVFRVFGIGVLEFEISVFNRWGEIVYQSTDINEGWIGEVSDRFYYAQNETYNYLIVAKGYGAESFTQKGILTVLR